MKRIEATLQADDADALAGTKYAPRLEETHRLLEYQYMRINPGLTHDQYETLGMDHIRWTIRIHNLVEADRVRREKKANS